MSLIRSSFRRPSSISTKAEMSIMPSHQLVATPTWPLQHVHMRSTFSTRTFSKAEAIAPSWLHGCMAWVSQFLLSSAARRGVAAADRPETLVVLAWSEMQVYKKQPTDEMRHAAAVLSISLAKA